MDVLADMGVSQRTVQWLAASGHNVAHVRDQGMQTARDSEIIGEARREGRVVITFDLDFGDIMAASGDNLPSVIILRLENETPAHVNARLAQVLEQVAVPLQNGAIVIVEDARHRVRLLPI